jgi:hypothetical protein
VSTHVALLDTTNSVILTQCCFDYNNFCVLYYQNPRGMSHTEKTTGLYKPWCSLMAAEFWPRVVRAFVRVRLYNVLCMCDCTTCCVCAIVQRVVYVRLYNVLCMCDCTTCCVCAIVQRVVYVRLYNVLCMCDCTMCCVDKLLVFFPYIKANIAYSNQYPFCCKWLDAANFKPSEPYTQQTQKGNDSFLPIAHT